VTDLDAALQAPGWPTRVYWLYDYTGRLLYVGMGSSAHERLLDHARTKDWWPEVDETRTVVRRYPTRDYARVVELRAIQTEKPLHNVLGTSKHAERCLSSRRQPKGDVRPGKAIGGPVAGTAEIADRLGVSRQRVQQLIGRPDWPEPFVVLAMGKVWWTKDVEAWIRDHRPADPGPETDEQEGPLGKRHGRTRRSPDA